MNILKNLNKKISAKKAKIGVVGLGYVGLPLACAFAEAGFQVVGIDTNKEWVLDINKGTSRVSDVKSTTLRKVLRSKRFHAQSDYSLIETLDVVIVCVPTPLNRVKDPDISYIVNAAEGILRGLRQGQLIILESTTYPGTTEEVILPTLEQSGLKVGKDFSLCFAPERIDPGNKLYPVSKIPKVVGGVTKTCTELGSTLYTKLTREVVPVSSPKTAEMTKLLENTFRIVNIGLINELARAAKDLDVDIWEAVKAASTKPFGFMPFYPGPGIGGHCIGIDPIYLSWKARLHGTNLYFIELARRMNSEMPEYVASRIAFLLNERMRKAVSKSRFLILGASYKPDVPDTRESPAIDIIQRLEASGGAVDYHDPHVPKLKLESRTKKSVRLTATGLQKYDMVVVITNHSSVDYQLVVRKAKLIFDTRNVLHAFRKDNIVRL